MSNTISRPATRISLIRHGHVYNPDEIFYGRLPGFRLDSTGRQETRQCAEMLKRKNLDGIYSSPMLRARQTAAEILKFHPHLKLSLSSLITEIYSAFQGQPANQLAQYSWDVYAGRDSNFEQPEDVVRRAKKFLRRIRKLHDGRHIAAVTHGDVILFVIFMAKKIPATAENKLRLNDLGILKDYPATGSITTLTYQTADMAEIPAISYSVPGH